MTVLGLAHHLGTSTNIEFIYSSVYYINGYLLQVTSPTMVQWCLLSGNFDLCTDNKCVGYNIFLLIGNVIQRRQ